MTATEHRPAKTSSGERVADWFDGRLGVYALGRRYLRKVFPDHWSFLLGEICLYSFVVLILTGVYLTLSRRSRPSTRSRTALVRSPGPPDG